MNFFQQPPSKQWAALKYRGEKFAEVWFKPDGEPLALTFRIPKKSFLIPGIGQQITAESLFKAVAIAPQEIESWEPGNICHACNNGANPELRNPLSPPPQEVAHLEVLVRLKPPRPSESIAPETPTEEWQVLEARWKGILGLEASVDTLRISMEGLQGEMDASLRKTLTHEEKLHARGADMSQWNKAKARVHYALPRVREYIHRATWAMGAPERRQLGELFKDHPEGEVPISQLNKLPEQLENLQKDRQVLAAQGVTVFQECKNISMKVQEALRTLQNNAAANACSKKQGAAGGKFFKQIRRISGA
jgi:hypothetical protein